MWLKLVFALSALLVMVAQEFLNPFILWNWLPIAAAYFLAERLRQGKRQNGVTPPARRIGGVIGFALPATGLVVFTHLAWLYDWWATKTSSSTSALIFIFIPFYAMLLGGVGYGIGWLLGRLIEMVGSRGRKSP